MTLRVLTYNILQGGRRGAPLDEVVQAVAPDVLVVNECPKAPVVWRLGCARLAERWGMRVAAGGRPAGSNLLLVRTGVAVRSAGAARIPQPAFAPRRGVVWAQLRVRGVLVGVVGCHLGLDPDKRPDEVERVLAAARGLRGPVLLAGDLNERPGGPSWARLHRAGFVDPGDDGWLTFPSDAPRKRIDALLVRGDARVLRHGDPGVAADLLSRASDHRPVRLELDLGAAPA